jgi:TonB-dependent receptor
MCCLAMSVLVANPAPAQAPRRIVIPPRPLDRALLDLARQSGRNILFAPNSVAGLLSGRVDARDLDMALRQMLAGLPVRVVRQRAGVALVRQRPAPRPRIGKRRPAAVPASQPLSAPPEAEILVIGAHFRPDLPVAPDIGVATDALAGDRAPATDRNLAEAVARMPGVLTLTTNLQGDLGGIDRAARAEGQFAAIRGLSGAYTVATIDGVMLPQSMPYGRDAQLGMLPAFGFASVQLVKTPGAERAGDATAGLIEVASPSAFDASLTGFQIVAAGGIDGSARSYDQDAGYGQLGFRIARRFGAGDALGIAVSGQFGRRAFANSQQTYQQDTVEFRRVDAAGNSPAGVDPADNLLLTSVNPQFTRGTTRSASAMAALDYRPSGVLSLFARLSYAGSWTTQDIYQLGFQGGNRATDITRTPLPDGSSALESSGGEIHYWYQTNPECSRFLLGQLGGMAQLGASDLHVRLHWGSGLTSRPDHIETSFWSPAASPLAGGVEVDLRDGYPVPRLTPAQSENARNALGYPIRLQAELRDQYSEDQRFGGDAVLTRRFDNGVLRLLEVGGALTRSQRRIRLVNYEYADLYPAGTLLGETGLVQSSIPAILPGIYDFPLPLIDGAQLRARIDAADAPPLTPDDANRQSLDVEEVLASAFLRARVTLGPVVLTPGLRAEQSWIDARYWVAGNQGVDAGGTDYGWNHGSARFGALLPSMALHWSPSAEEVIRAALWTSYARPSANQLAGGETLETTATGTRRIIRGNPDLRAVRALNLDASYEWKAPDQARVSIAVFGKRLAHFLYDAGSDYANVREVAEAGLLVTKPRNGGVARLFGAEMSGVIPLARLASGLSGWTIAAQATFLRARVRLHNPLLSAVEHVQYAPAHNVSAEIGYADARWSAALTGRRTGAYLQQYGLFGTSASGNSVLNGSALDIWVQPSQQFDFNLARSLESGGTVRLFARNLLADRAYRSTMSRHSDSVSQTVATGRLVGLRYDRNF